jgi:O-antigen ligase
MPLWRARWLALLVGSSPAPVRVAVAALLAVGALAMTIVGAIPAAELGPGGGRFFILLVMVLAPAIAAWLVLSPWPGLLAWVTAMAFLNIPRVQVWAGALQVTLSTLLLVSFAVGCLWDRRVDSAAQSSSSRGGARATLVVAAALVVMAVASLATSPDVVTGLPIVVHGAIEPIVLAALVLSLRPSARRLLGLALAMGACVSLASAYSILRIGKVASTLAEVEASRAQLAHFTFHNVGIFGDVLAMGLTLLLGTLLARRAFGLRWPALLAIAAGLLVSSAALYLTYSKSAWLGAGISFLLLFLAYLRVWWQRGLLLVTILLAGSLLIPWPLYLMRAAGIDTSDANPYVHLISRIQGQRLSSWDVNSSDGEVSVAERWLATRAAIEMALDHPLTGVGPGRFGVEYVGPYHDPAATRTLGSAHDLLPNVAAEFGLPAVLALAAVLVASLVGAFRAAMRGDAWIRAMGLAFGAAMVAFLVVSATFGLDLFRPDRVMNSDVLFASLIAAGCLALGRLGQRSPPPGGEAEVLEMSTA